MGYSPRLPVADSFLHVRTRATGNELLFRDDRDYDSMGWLLGREVLHHDWRCLAYCLMPNHVHFVLRPLRESLPAGMRDLLSSHTRRFNERWARRGHLVERRYRVTHAADEQHLYRIMRYVPLNPVEAGLSARPELWPHGSYAATIGLEEPPVWLDVDGALRLFDRDARRARHLYRDFVEQGLKQTCPRL